MKKVLTFLTLAAALVAVSCAKEQEDPSVGKATVTFTVDAGQIVTRAVSGTHGDATRLRVGVYHKNGTEYKYLSDLAQSREVISWPTTVSLELAKNETYKLVFWADEGTDAYTIDWTNGTVVETATTIAGNLINRDAYYKLVELTTTGAASGEAITLVRPLAQVNVGTSDLASYKAAAAYDGNVETQVVISGVAPGLNLLTGAATSGETKTLTFSYANNLGATLVSDSKNYDYMALNYILCPADATLTAAVSLRKENVTTETINDFTVSYMPVKQNYRTNIVGKLLTGTVYYTVDVDTNFINDLNKPIGPTFSSLADLNTYLGTLKEGTSDGDNGDVTPEQAILTAMGDLSGISGNPQVVLPKIHGDVDIRLVFPYAGTLEVVYADGATDAQKPANIYFYAQKLDNLTATVPASHFELLSGSVVTTKAIVSTNTTTFVIQHGAKVGTAEIQKGNAEISGKVDVVSVPAGAKADDSGAPVQIKLEKESAVEQIVLNAATDVVVEQPKDNIEVSGTEYKVEVVVNVDDCSATAQNGGQIYVRVADDVTCDVTADGQSSAEEGSVASAVTIAEVGTGATVNTEASDGGQIIPPAPEDNHGEIAAYVAKIGEAKYLTIEEAVAAVKDGETIIVLTDITQDNGILFDKENISAKLDLNSKTITINSGSNVNYRAFRIDNGALEVYGGSIIAVGEGTNSSNGTGCYGAFRIEANGALNAHDLTLMNSRPWGLNVKVLGGTAILTNVNITSSYGGGIEVTEADLGAQSKKGTAVLTNCHFTQTGYFDHCSSTLSVSGGSSLTINSGSYESENYALYVFSSGGEITVNDGTFSGNKDGVAIVAAIDLNTYPSYTGGLKLKDGVYQGGYTITSPAYMEVSGGKYSVDPTAFLAAGLEANLDGDGWWVVGPAVWSGAVASDEQFNASVDATAKTVTVSSTAVLAKLAANVQAGNNYEGYKITLTKDMDLNNQEWTPIGENGKNFAGEFDGGGHTISNLKITRAFADVDANWRIGFIGSAIGAKVHDLTIHNANVLARGEVAAAVGYNAYSVEGKPSEIYNVNVTGHVVVTAAYRGAAAICGYSNYYVHECTVNVDETSIIDGFWATGGIVGFSPQSGNIKNNYSNIKVVSDYACGGIVGLIEDSVEISGNTVENTTLEASANYGIGGIIGMMNYGTGLRIKNNTVSNVVINATENVASVIGAVWADDGTGAVEISNNTLNGITINSSKGDGTAAFIGYVEANRTATITGNTIQGTINTAKPLVNDGIWAGATDAANVTASGNTMNIITNIVE